MMEKNLLPIYPSLLWISLLVTTTGTTSCSGPATDPTPHSSRIAWDYSSLQEIAPIGDYPRMRRLTEERIAVVYENGYGSTVIRYSDDEGQSWSEPDTLFHRFTARSDHDSALVWISNPELIRLKSGELLAACNYRPQKAGVYPFAIAIRRSTDAGATWSPPQTVYQAGKAFGDGCWEPAFLELPNGDLHIYFSNEGIFTESDEQDIEVLISHDKGVSWEPQPRRVCFRAGKRDGMAVATLVGDEILVSIEDNRIGEFKPSIVRTTLTDCWQTPVLADSPMREPALLEPLHDTIYAGAPYLITLPTGETALSYQTTRGRTNDWELSTMEVAVGDRQGRNFTKVTQPFAIPTDRLAKWNSIAVFDKDRIAALSGCNYLGGRVGVWMILGHIIPEQLTTVRSHIHPDGLLTEWDGQTMPLFVGHQGKSNLRFGFCRQSKNLCLAIRINTEMKTPAGANLYIATRTNRYRIGTSAQSPVSISLLCDDNWEPLPSHPTIQSGICLDDKGYSLEAKIPLSLLDLQRGDSARITAGLITPNLDGTLHEELIVHSIQNDPSTWCSLQIQ